MVLPVDRADEPLDRLKPVTCHFIEGNNRGERLPRLRLAEKCQLRAGGRSHMAADLVMPTGGKWDVEGAALPRAQIRRNLNKIDDPRINLRRPINGLLDRGLVWPGSETVTPSVCAARALPWSSGRQ
ncbi:hypothetical protein [Mesorhizobium sp. M2E.F.Ca.ET.209.01.1.1]|uniref:hypothetical protein n=1 Tax=Mesorhizobium sp. M2E.F.Ca.ET.209.01.1.1 TaxID=2500526 RepID=UPI001FEFC87C|nr:hypothetical protein [Mesorhizobium sp. M2E.F.Ca.ET.209.01.1.1]